MLARQAIYHLSHALSPVLLQLFLDRVSCFSAPGMASYHNILPSSAFLMLGRLQVCNTMPSLLPPLLLK
jgi:hypothetical protein